MSGGSDPAQTADVERERTVTDTEPTNEAGAAKDDDVVDISSAQARPPRWLQPLRNAVLRLPGGELIWKIVVGIVGGAIVVLGFLLIPLPGPGWAIVFLGLAVWATEFAWAYRLLLFGRRTLKSWTDWLLRQNLFVRGLVGLAGLALLAALAYAGWYLFIR